MEPLSLIPLSPKFSDIYLKKYIGTFLDPQRFNYNIYKAMESLRKRKGYKSSGLYLWDYLKNGKPLSGPHIISIQTLTSYTYKFKKPVLVYWDKEYIDPSSQFASTESICLIPFEYIAKHPEACPSNLYIFDRDFRWTLIITNEPQNELDWTCFQAGEIGACGN